MSMLITQTLLSHAELPTFETLSLNPSASTMPCYVDMNRKYGIVEAFCKAKFSILINFVF